MTFWYEQPFAAFDTESTGVDVFKDRIVTATVAFIRPDLPDQKPRTCSWLINPGIDIPAEATKVHGITTEKARTEGAVASVALPGIVRALRQAVSHGPLVVYNASFDLSLLNIELERAGMESLPTPTVIDPFCIDRALDRYRKGSRTLTALCKHYMVRLDAAHDAVQDALAAARLAWRMTSAVRPSDTPCPCHPPEYVNPLRLPKPDRRFLRDVPLDELQGLQARWSAERADSYRDYLTKQGKDASDVCGDWPIRLPVEVVP